MESEINVAWKSKRWRITNVVARTKSTKVRWSDVIALIEPKPQKIVRIE